MQDQVTEVNIKWQYRILLFYLRHLEVNPLLTKCLTNAFLNGLQEFTALWFTSKEKKNFLSLSLKKENLSKIIKMTAYGISKVGILTA
jgi:hypothetical protein